MTGLYQAQIILAATSSVPADISVNTMHFRVNGTTSVPFVEFTDLDVITGQRDLAPDVNGIQGDLSDLFVTLEDMFAPSIDFAASRIKWTNLSDPMPRVPLAELPFDPVPTVGGNTLPQEVAIVSSFQGERESGVPQSRRRNRIYLGPLRGTIISGVEGLVPAFNRTAIRDAFVNFAQNSAADNFWSWRVYSPTDGIDVPVTDGWIDNAWDTQRRRGVKATERTAWTESST